MSRDLAVKRILNCIKASRQTLNPQFYAYWLDTAETLARKYNVNLGELVNEESVETMGESTGRESVH
jgi:hypothetical protein